MHTVTEDAFRELQEAANKLGEEDDPFEIGEATMAVFGRVLERWAKAFHYREMRRIVPAQGRIQVMLFGYADAENIPREALFGREHVLQRNGANIGDQLAYVTWIDSDHLSLGYYTVAFRRAFLAVLLVDCDHELAEWPQE